MEEEIKEKYSKYLKIGLIILFVSTVLIVIWLAPKVFAATNIVTKHNFTDTTNNKAYNASGPGNFNWTGKLANTSAYTSIKTRGGTPKYWNTTSSTTNRDPTERFNFTINEAVGTIKSIYIEYTGRAKSSAAAETANLYFWNNTNKNWTKIELISKTANTNITKNVSTGFSNYIGSNKQLVLFVQGVLMDSGEGIATDFVQVTVYSTDKNPKWSSNSSNGTIAGTYVKHLVKWTDDVGLSSYKFSFDNGTGTFVNDSVVAFSGTSNWVNVTKGISKTTGVTIRWRVWANDTSDNTNQTAIFSYLTTSASSCTYPGSGNWAINLADFCRITTNTSVGSNSITFTGTGNVTFNATIMALSIGALPANQKGFLGTNARVKVG